MIEKILNFTQGVTLLGGGAATPSLLREALKRAPILFCADGGANHLVGQNLNPRAIIGDFDSLDNANDWRTKTELIEVEEQDSTDFQKCLSRINAPFFICVGFMGGRFDHSLASLDALIGDDRAIVLSGEQDICFAPRNPVALNLPIGTRVSIYPLRPVTATGGEGLKYPIDGLSMETGRQIGVSNEMAASEAKFGFDGPGAVVIIGSNHLDAALNGLGVLFQPPI